MLHPMFSRLSYRTPPSPLGGAIFWRLTGSFRAATVQGTATTLAVPFRFRFCLREFGCLRDQRCDRCHDISYSCRTYSGPPIIGSRGPIAKTDQSWRAIRTTRAIGPLNRLSGGLRAPGPRTLGFLDADGSPVRLLVGSPTLSNLLTL